MGEAAAWCRSIPIQPTQHVPVSEAWRLLVDLRVRRASDEAERLAVCLVLYAWAARHSVTRNRYGVHVAGLQVLVARVENGRLTASGATGDENKSCPETSIGGAGSVLITLL